jgi:hypothetical protein
MSTPSQIEELAERWARHVPENTRAIQKARTILALQALETQLTAAHASQTAEHEKQVAELTRKLEDAYKERDRFLAPLRAIIPHTYGDAVIEGVDLGDLENHNWDNKTTEEQSAWLIEHLRTQLAESQAARLAAEEKVEGLTYKSTQATECAGCGVRKHTPLRRDEMGGYVCLTCIDRRLDALLQPETNE